jgi:hypothetical protein
VKVLPNLKIIRFSGLTPTRLGKNCSRYGLIWGPTSVEISGYGEDFPTVSTALRFAMFHLPQIEELKISNCVGTSRDCLDINTRKKSRQFSTVSIRRCDIPPFSVLKFIHRYAHNLRSFEYEYCNPKAFGTPDESPIDIFHTGLWKSRPTLEHLVLLTDSVLNLASSRFGTLVVFSNLKHLEMSMAGLRPGPLFGNEDLADRLPQSLETLHIHEGIWTYMMNQMITVAEFCQTRFRSLRRVTVDLITLDATGDPRGRFNAPAQVTHQWREDLIWRLEEKFKNCKVYANFTERMVPLTGNGKAYPVEWMTWSIVSI